ncbi:hypothetical protein F442_14639 [Phytophthora nicotianae P10297]|uniref:Ribonucleotide reductase large subunit domain-containing protein n=1 Tax=Phytophthora nicotianae P10297 TaxID=1317064 RepID=W2YSB8_PHYNI|nr:hypothetical protein F442_14639 [Phytophthora nicotianae P10297]
MWDWSTLKKDIINHGLRNSLLVALMPVAGTSFVMGSTIEGVEPLQINIFTRSTLSGRFQVVNKYLMRDLKALGLWTKRIRNKIIEHDGSVQLIKEIPEEIRNVYKTVYEYKLISLIKMEAQRNCYVCQSTSSNRYLSAPDVSLLTNVHLYAWKMGLKTSSYYYRIQMSHTAKKYMEREEEEECLCCQA